MPLPLVGLAIGLASKFAPELIGKIAGDKAEKIAGQVIGLATGITGEPDGEAAMAALEAHPELAHEFRMRAAELDAELEQAYLVDRQNARARDMAIAATGQKNIRADILAYGSLALLAMMVLLLRFGPEMDQSMREALFLLIGIAGALVKDVFSFEFGSSRGSKNKETIMASWE